MAIVEIVIAVVSALSVLFFLLYVVAMLRMPLASRPKTPTFDRFGGHLPAGVPPGFEETEDEYEAP